MYFSRPHRWKRKGPKSGECGATQLLLLYLSISHYIYYEVHLAQVG